MLTVYNKTPKQSDSGESSTNSPVAVLAQILLPKDQSCGMRSRLGRKGTYRPLGDTGNLVTMWISVNDEGGR